MLRTLRILLWSLVALGLLGVGTYFYLGQQKGAVQPLASIGGPFKLAATTGETIDSTALKGEPFAVFFGFTHCPEVCPTTLYELDGWLKALGPEGEAIRAYFVSIDPERDTPETLDLYVSNVSDRVTGITGEPDKVAAMAKSFAIYVRKVPLDGDDYTMDHTASVLLLGRRGDFFGTIAYGENAETAMAKLRRLAREG